MNSVVLTAVHIANIMIQVCTIGGLEYVRAIRIWQERKWTSSIKQFSTNSLKYDDTIVNPCATMSTEKQVLNISMVMRIESNIKRFHWFHLYNWNMYQGYNTMHVNQKRRITCCTCRPTYILQIWQDLKQFLHVQHVMDKGQMQCKHTTVICSKSVLTNNHATNVPLVSSCVISTGICNVSLNNVLEILKILYLSLYQEYLQIISKMRSDLKYDDNCVYLFKLKHLQQMPSVYSIQIHYAHSLVLPVAYELLNVLCAMLEDEQINSFYSDTSDNFFWRLCQ